MIQNYTWYNRKLNLNSPDAVHQILVYGNLQDIKQLINIIGEERLKSVFVNHPKNVYTKADFNFIKNFILKIKEPLDDKKYLKTSPRTFGSKTAKIT